MAQALGHVQEVTGSLDKIHFMNGGKCSSHSPSCFDSSHKNPSITDSC